MGILDKFFKPAGDIQTGTPPVMVPTSPTSIPRNNTNTANPNNIDPTTGKQPVSAVPDTPPTIDPNNPDSARTHANPLDVYREILDNQNKGDSNLPPSFDIPEAELDKVVSGLDFTSNVPPELLERAVSGGDPKAFMEILALSTRQAYKTAIQHTTKLTEAQFGQRSNYDDTRMQKAVKSGLVDNSLSSVNNYNHPVARKELNRVASDMAIQYPDKTPQQIADAARDYLQQVAAAIQNPKQALPGQHLDPTGKEMEFDWGSYLSKDSSTSP